MNSHAGEAPGSRSISRRRRALWLAAGGTLLLPSAGMAAYYAPAQLRSVYGFNALPSSVNGSGQTIAIIDFGNDPYINSDLSTFDSNFGFSAPPKFTIENENGSTMTSQLPAMGDGNSILETSIDVEFAHSIAPNANIILVEAPPIDVATQDDLNTANDTVSTQASVVSMSFGTPGGLGSSGDEASADLHFNYSGVTFVASSGDHGLWNYPASSPYVIGVGGTSLTVNGGVNNGFINATGGTYGGETVWNSGGSGGGGVDPYEPIPSYQVGIASGPNRNEPDVSYDADPNTGEDFVYEGGIYGGIGGTSIGAPQWAALIALADQLRASESLSTLSSTQSLTLMYNSYSDPALYAQLFHDVTTGSNEDGDAAGPGYDDVTGLGSPIANMLVDYLGGFSRVWDGKADGTTWDINGHQNWNDGAVSNAAYFDGTNITFDDVNTSGNSITLRTTVAPAEVTVNSTVNNYTFGGTGSLGGLGTLTKLGASTLTITTNNGYSGGTIISGGTIQVGNGGSTGNLGGGGVTDIGALVLDRGDTGLTFGNDISGSGSVAQIGSGTVTLTGNNTYSGGTTISAGTLAIGAWGALPGGRAVVNNATLAVNSDSTAGNVSGSGKTIVGNGVNFMAGNFSQGSLVDNGATTITGNGTVGGITGAGSLTIGTGTTSNTLTLATSSGGSAVSALTILGSAALDVNNDHLFISYGANPDPSTTIRAYLQSGFNNGGWNGTGLVSSAAAATQASSSKYALGYADSADPGNPAGLPLDTIEVKYTLVGDLNLDGAVSGADFAILAGNFNSLSQPRWDAGDVNYDGAVSGADFAALAANFGKLDSGAAIALSAADWAAFDAFAGGQSGFGASVPEPATGGLLVLGGLGMLLSRRQRGA